MIVLVTGGNGFIGREVCRSLISKGHEPLVLDRHGRPPVPGAELMLGDISNAETVTEAMAHSEAWIHLAGVLGTAETIANPRPAAAVNVLGGLNVLEAAAQYHLPGVNIAVGNWWMNNTYAITKNSVERFVEMYREERGQAFTTVRALNAYGEGQSVAAPFGSSKVRKIMPAFVCRALLGQQIEVYGDGEQIMDMIYVSDAADVLVAALEHTIEHGGCKQVIEAGTGRSTTVNEIAETVVMEAGVLETNAITHSPMRPGEPEQSIVIGHPETLDEIGYDPENLITLEDGVARTVKWFRENWLDDYQAAR